MKTALRLTPARALLGAGLFVISHPLLAEAAVDADSTPEPLTVDEIVVTAQKREQRAQDVPISLSVMGGSELENSSLQSVMDVLNQVPGVAVDVTGESGETRLSIRGVAASGPLFAGASPIAYYLDSTPFGLVRSAIVPDANIYDLDRVEVLRGPQGTLYGASALNGVVRVLTHDADLNEFDFKGRAGLSTTASGAGNYDGDMAVNVPIVDDKLAARLVVDETHDSGWINSPLKSNVNDDDKKSVRLKITAQPIDDLTIKLSALHQEIFYGAPPEGTDDYTPSTQNQPIYIHYNVFGGTAVYQTPWFSVSSASSYMTYYNYSSLDENPAAGTSYDPPLTTLLNSHIFSEEVNLTSTLEGPWRWSAGAFYRDAVDSFQQTYGHYISAPLDEQDSSRSAAIYGEVARRFLENQLELALGGRYFHDDVGMRQRLLYGQAAGTPLLDSTTPYHATTPRVVLTWFRQRDLTMYTSFSEGFRSGFPQDYLVQVSAPDLATVKPDKLYNYEVGGKSRLFDNRLSVDAAVYFMKWDDIQQLLAITIPGSTTYIKAGVNGQSASGMGVDLAVTVRPFQGLSLGVNFSWNGLTEDSAVYSSGKLLFPKGSRIDASPAYTGGVLAQYTVPFGASGWSGTLAANGRYTSTQTTTQVASTAGSPPDVVESNTIMTGDVNFTIGAPSHWRVMLYSDNVTNNDRVPLAAKTPYMSISMRPRTTGVQVEYSYK